MRQVVATGDGVVLKVFGKASWGVQGCGAAGAYLGGSCLPTGFLAPQVISLSPTLSAVQFYDLSFQEMAPLQQLCPGGIRSFGTDPARCWGPLVLRASAGDVPRSSRMCALGTLFCRRRKTRRQEPQGYGCHSWHPQQSTHRLRGRPGPRRC